MSENLTQGQMLEKLTAKTNDWKAVLAKGDDLTIEDLEKASALKAEVLELKGQFERFNAVAAQQDDLKAAEDYLHKPVRTVPHAHAHATVGDESERRKGEFELVGKDNAGYAELEYKGTQVKVVHETGAGTFGERKWKAICTDEYRDAFVSYVRNKGELSSLDRAERKTLEEGFDDQGGYTVPVDAILNSIISRKPTPTRVAAMCSNINTSREYAEMIKLNYASDNTYSTGFRVTKTGEQPASATSAQVADTNLFGTIKIPVHTFMIRGLLTQNMIEDSAVGIINWMGGKFSETADILKDDKVLNGTGRMEPLGMTQNFAGSANGAGLDDPKISVINSGDANTITADALINLALDVPEQYDDNCKFIFNKTSTFKAIRTLKDLNDRYLFGSGLQDSGLVTPVRPTDLIGYSYAFSGLMPNTAAGNYPVLFGDVSGYQIVNRIGFSVRVLNELYAETNAVSILGRIRFGGATISPWGLRLLKISA